MYDIQIFSNAWHVLSALIIFISGLIITFPLSKYFNIGTKIGVVFYLYHSFFSMIYLFYVINFGGDAIGYYRNSMLPLPDFKPGTIGLYHIVSYLHQLDLSIVGCFLIFNLLGCIGLLAFYSSLRSITINSSVKTKRIVLLAVFLPSVSFWSSGMGKDAISFMAMGLALYAALNFNRRLGLMTLAIAFMLFVRPHIAGMLIIAISISIIVQKNIPLILRIFVGSLALAVSAVMIPFALNYAGVSEDASNLESYIEERANSNLGGGSSLDIASMPLPAQMFTYLFRPLPVEARSITQLLASIDNILLLYLFFVGFKAKKRLKNIQLDGNRVFMWSYVIISWVILSMTTANLGIAMRQKWMFTPILVFLLISLLAAVDKKRTKKD